MGIGNADWGGAILGVTTLAVVKDIFGKSKSKIKTSKRKYAKKKSKLKKRNHKTKEKEFKKDFPY